MSFLISLIKFKLRSKDMKNNAFSKFNLKNTLMVFSSYALKDEDLNNQNALSWYTKELLSVFPQKQKIVVLSERESPESHDIAQKNNILVIPSWQKRDFFSLFRLISYFFQFNKAERVLFEFEFNIFGNLFGPLITLILMFILKITGKKTYFHLHQVVTSLKSLKNQVNIKESGIISLFNIGLGIFYRLIGLFSEKVIVTERSLAKKLGKYVNEEKITILPILVDKKNIYKKNDVYTNKYKKLKGKKIILFFGYLSWYKGIDWLVDVFSKITKKLPDHILVVAGGKSPTLAGKTHYENYYQRLKNAMNKNKNIVHTGFIDEQEIGYLMESSSALILPYRGFMSSSGPLSWAMTYKKPVIFSKYLKEYKISNDFKLAMKKNKIKDSELFFDLETSSLLRTLTSIPLKKLADFSNSLSHSRSKSAVARKLQDILKDKSKKSFIFRMKTSFRFPNLVRFLYAK